MTIRIYEMYRTPRGVTCQSLANLGGGKGIIHVAAKSIKQAYFLAGNNMWFKEGSKVGIVEASREWDSEEWDWKHWDGRKDRIAEYKHYQTFKVPVVKHDEPKPEKQESQLTIRQGVHYRDYIASGENVEVTRIGQDTFRFRVSVRPIVEFTWADSDKVRNMSDAVVIQCDEFMEPFVIDAETDLAAVDLDILDELDKQMSNEGECYDDWVRFAKFSETRRNIQRHMSKAEKHNLET